MKRKIDTGGFSQFYTGVLEQSPVLLLAYTLKEKVDAEKLQAAAVRAVDAFPVFRVKLTLDEKRQPVYEENENVPCIYEDDGIPHAFGRESRGFLFRISYKEKQIRLSIHHMLTDFSGANAFLVYILRCYLNQVDGNIDCSENTISLDPADLRDPYDLYGNINSAGYNFADKWTNEVFIPNRMQYRRFERHSFRALVFPVEKMLLAAKKTDSSVFPLLFWLMANATIATYKTEDRILVAGGAANYRAKYDSRTPLNFSQSFSMIFLPRERSLDYETQLTVQRARMDLQLDRRTIDREIALRKESMTQRDKPIENYVMDQETLDQKRKEEEKKSAFYISYPGRIDLPGDIAEYVEDFYYNSPTTRGALRAAAYSWGGNMVVNISELNCEKTIAPAIREILKKFGVESRLSDLREASYDTYPMEELVFDDRSDFNAKCSIL